MTDPLRAAILGDRASVHMPTSATGVTVEVAVISPDDAAARVRAMPTSDEAVERGGRAIYDAHWGGTISRAPWEAYVNRDVFLRDARAAILALLGDPT